MSFDGVHGGAAEVGSEAQNFRIVLLEHEDPGDVAAGHEAPFTGLEHSAERRPRRGFDNFDEE